jgi:competence protein ComEA
MKSVLYSLFGVIAGFILAGILLYVSRAPAGEPIVLQPAPTEAPIAVHVLGGVARPGLYKFPEGARVQDAIDAAGGLLTTADVATLNLARKVTDGEQLNIPCKDNACPVDTTTLDLPNATEAPVDTSGLSSGELININTATLEELDSLPGIGPSTAQKIIEYRNLNGCFFMPEDLLNVSGIGPVTLDKIRDLIIVECQ